MNGLSTPADIEALADQLSAAANALHARVLKDIKAHGDEHAIRQLLDDEILLRERANALYADAAARVVAGLSAPQAHIVALTADATAKIAAVARLSHALDIAAALAALSGAAMTGQPAPIVLALEKLRHSLQAPAPS